MRWIVRNPKFSIPAGVVVLCGLAWLAFGFFGVHLLLVDDKIAEAPPVFAATETGATTTNGSASTTAPSSPAATDPPVAVAPGAAPSTSSPATTVSVVPVAPAAPQPVIVTEYVGSFVGRAHPTSGNALVLGDGTGQRFVRFEEFETDNGPDLNVYLVNSSASGIEDFVDLGDLKGNIGDQNYQIPADTDLDVYDTVLIWCVRFSSPFGEATLSST